MYYVGYDGGEYNEKINKCVCSNIVELERLDDKFLSFPARIKKVSEE